MEMNNECHLRHPSHPAVDCKVCTSYSLQSTFDHVTPSMPRLGPGPPHLHLSLLHPRCPANDRRLSQHSQAPPRRTSILTAEDTQIAQDTSADATNTPHIENPVGPRRAR